MGVAKNCDSYFRQHENELSGVDNEISGYSTEASILNFDSRVEMCVHENQLSAHAPSIHVPPDPTLLEFAINLAYMNHKEAINS